MIKTFPFILLFIITYSNSFAQNKYTDSLLYRLAIAKNDTSRVLIMADLCYFYRYQNIDSSLLYGRNALALAQQIKFLRGEADALNKTGLALREKGDLPKALELLLKALKIAEDNNYILETANCFRRIGLVYMDLKDYPKALIYLKEALKRSELIQHKRGQAIEYMNLGMTYEYMGQLDSALYYGQKAFDEKEHLVDLVPEVFRVLGMIQTKKGNKQLAITYYQEGIRLGKKIMTTEPFRSFMPMPLKCISK